MTDTPGPLALAGGAEWTEPADFDAELLERSGGTEVLVLPTAAAFERPEKAVDTARRYFERLGGTVRPLMVLRHEEALDEGAAKVASQSRFIYLSGGSPLHLRSVLKGSRLLEAIVSAWRAGAVLAGSSAGAMVLCDPMVDPRGGAFTVGLGVVEQLAVIPHFSPESHLLWRTLELAPSGVPLAGIPERTALVHDEAGWRTAGAAPDGVTIYLDGAISGLEALPSQPRRSAVPG